MRGPLRERQSFYTGGLACSRRPRATAGGCGADYESVAGVRLKLVGDTNYSSGPVVLASSASLICGRCRNQGAGERKPYDVVLLFNQGVF